MTIFFLFFTFQNYLCVKNCQNRIPHHCLQQFSLYQCEAYGLFVLKNTCFVSADSVINVVYQYI